MFHRTVDNKTVDVCDIAYVSDCSTAQCGMYEMALKAICEKTQKRTAKVERWLWHGTSYDVSQTIIRNGFDRTYSTVAKYGKGTYFARDADYSAVERYSPTHSDGYQYMLLCRVIVGDSVVGSSGNNVMALKPNGDEYDTRVDNLTNPSIFVVWRDYRAMAVYLIKFKHK